MCNVKLPAVARQRIVSMGMVCIDQIASVASFPEPDAKIRSTEFEEYCGGNAANAAVAARRLGVEMLMFSAVGEDARGESAIEALSLAGVDVSVLQRVYKARTPFTYVIVDANADTRTCIHTPALGLTVPFIPNVHKPLIESADMVILDGRYSDTAFKCAQVARSANVPVLLDAERMREGTEELISMASGVVVKDALANELAPEAQGAECEALVKLLDRGPNWVIATRGKQGCVLVKRANNVHLIQRKQFTEYNLELRRRIIANGEVEVVYCSAVDGINVVDSTGTGDAFFGALAFGVVSGIDLYKSIALASVVAGLSCQGRGAQSSPTRDVVLQYLSKATKSVGTV